MESECTIKSKIFEAIRRLRNRKARPDVDRICGYVRRQLSVDIDLVLKEIQELVSDKILLKVRYRGEYSYRIAQGTVKKNGLNNNLISDAICNAVKDSGGASVVFIDDYLKKHHSGVQLGLDELESAVREEVNSGNLRISLNGRYVLSRQRKRKFVEMDPREDSEDISNEIIDKRDSKETESVDEENEEFKKPDKPSTLKKRTRAVTFANKPDSSEHPKNNDQCIYCGKHKNCSSETESFLICHSCSSKAHPSCMGYSQHLVKQCRSYPWQCMNCKTCTICTDSGDDGVMLFCDSCDKGYHTDCHKPEVKTPPKGLWSCFACDVKLEKDEDKNFDALENINEDFKNEDKASLKNHFEIDNAKNWSVKDVAEFFKTLGFIDEVSALSNQDIDGKSLLLLQREDIINGLSLKLGPALKIYQHVTKIQSCQLV